MRQAPAKIKSRHPVSSDRSKSELETLWTRVDLIYLGENAGDPSTQPFALRIEERASYGPVANLINGLLNGLAPAAGRNWFKLAGQAANTEWSKMVEDAVYDLLDERRDYDAIKLILGDLVAYGSAAARLEPDLEYLSVRRPSAQKQPSMTLTWPGRSPAIEALDYVSSHPGLIVIESEDTSSDSGKWYSDSVVCHYFFVPLCSTYKPSAALDRLTPMLYQIHTRLLIPLLEAAISSVLKAPGFPPRPNRSEKMEIRFTSPLAQAINVGRMDEKSASRAKSASAVGTLPRNLPWSPDFRVVWLGKKRHQMNEDQAKILLLIYTRSNEHPEDPWVIQKDILKAVLGENSYGAKLKSKFRRKLNVWAFLIKADPKQPWLVRFDPDLLQPLILPR